MTPAELGRALDVAKPFFDKCRQEWAAAMISTAPAATEQRESYYAMICGLNAVERKWRAAAMPNPQSQPAESTAEAGWNGLPMEQEHG